MHLPESIGYITRKLERALKLPKPAPTEPTTARYITRKLERALKLVVIATDEAIIAVLYNP